MTPPAARPNKLDVVADPISGSDEVSLATQLERFLSAFARVDALGRRDAGLNANERTALLHLANGTTSPTELSRHLGMTTAGTTNLLDRLVTNGFVTRERHASDGRRVLLTLTKQGLRVHMRLQQIATELATVASRGDVSASTELARFLGAATALLNERSGAADQ
ncbi:MAG: regulatory protein MarR [Thermoleophilia bacterium]|nr:regulatory protein MarR [Thermoleophilia bacterium]